GLLSVRPRLRQHQGAERETLQDQEAGQRGLLHHVTHAVQQPAAAGQPLPQACRRPVPLSVGRVPHPEAPDPGAGQGRLGDPPGLPAAGPQTGPGLLRGGLDGNVERDDARCHQDSEAGHHVPGGLPAGGAGHEEAAAREAGAAVRRGVRGAHLHRHRVHGA
ncbi:hypothetical protein CRUP_000789, partial [Coryphaenoides rupestris]